MQCEPRISTVVEPYSAFALISASRLVRTTLTYRREPWTIRKPPRMSSIKKFIAIIGISGSTLQFFIGQNVFVAVKALVSFNHQVCHVVQVRCRTSPHVDQASSPPHLCNMLDHCGKDLLW